MRYMFENTEWNLKKLNGMWENLFPVKQEEIIKKLIKTVWIRENGIEVCIETKGLEEVCSEYAA